MKICNNCVLPETFPGIRFNDEGICQFCERHSKVPEEKFFTTRERFFGKFEEILGKVKGKGTYDVLMAHSGGKDSTYTLKILVDDFNLRVIAFTFDQGFISPMAKENIRIVCANLDVDHVLITPGRSGMIKTFRESVTTDVYPLKALERASAICNTCMYLAKASFLRYAVEMNIPLVAYGWSPGQAPVQSSAMKLNPPMIKQSQTLLVDSLGRIMNEGLKPYLLDSRHYQMIDAANEQFTGHFLYNIHPLAFMEYDEGKIIASIKDLGWQHPTDTDSNSSNCLLNSLANQVHLDRFGFHPYAFENAGLVRDGYMERKEGLEKLNQPMDERLVVKIKDKLGL